MNPTKYK